jgi:hypothetical protein
VVVAGGTGAGGGVAGVAGGAWASSVVAVRMKVSRRFLMMVVAERDVKKRDF